MCSQFSICYSWDVPTISMDCYEAMPEQTMTMTRSLDGHFVIELSMS
jgi:hypothetical protein